jgi:chromosomal replication initiator protein
VAGQFTIPKAIINKGAVMNVEQAWQSVLGQLQMEMPRASYDTWVRDTRPIKYEKGLLTVSVRNAYARDWLESRLAGTVSRLLISIMDSNVSVNFVVSQSVDDEMSQSIESIEHAEEEALCLF